MWFGRGFKGRVLVRMRVQDRVGRQKDRLKVGQSGASVANVSGSWMMPHQPGI